VREIGLGSRGFAVGIGLVVISTETGSIKAVLLQNSQEFNRDHFWGKAHQFATGGQFPSLKLNIKRS
jgi:hypothetical protein